MLEAAESVSPALRLASLSPLSTEMLFQLGLGNQIVIGVASPGVPASQLLPSPGEWFSPSLEKLVRHQVQWVVTNQGALSLPLQRGLAAAKIPTFIFNIRDSADVAKESVRFFREVLGTEAPGWLKDWETCAHQKIQRQTSFTFLALVWGHPPILFGKETFLSRLIESLGGKNLVHTRLRIDYPQVSEEWLMTTQPEIVFVFDEFLKLETIEKLKHRYWATSQPQLRVLPAEHFGRSSFAMFDFLPELFPIHQRAEGNPCARP